MFVCPTCGLSTSNRGVCSEDGAPLEDAANDTMLGRTIGSHRLSRCIGRGGMGSVYLGVHPGIKSRVAVKVLSSVAAESPDLVERFFAEARAVNLIRHESIVNVIDQSVTGDGRPYIVMEYLEGAPLAAHFASRRPFPLDQLVRIAIETLGALDAAHRAGITHRDLKPENLFVTTLGRVKILDFGIAKLRPMHGVIVGATQTGALLGTPHYMSPEQARGEFVDPRSDLYSLGVVMFEGATGRLPFVADSLYDLFQLLVTKPPPAPSSLREDIPPALEKVILSALEKRREDRVQTAAELREALAAASVDLPQTSRPDWLTPRALASSALADAPTQPAQVQTSAGGIATTVAEATPIPTRSSSTTWLAAGAVALLLATGVGATAFFVGRSSERKNAAQPASSAKQNDKVIDLLGYLPTAMAEARQRLPDAELYHLSASGMKRDGSVDLSDVSHGLNYYFRSPKASLGSGNRACLVTISITLYGKFVNVLRDDNCATPLLEKPRCSMKHVLENVPGSQEIGSITLQWLPGGAKQQWALVMRDGSMHMIPDDC